MSQINYSMNSSQLKQIQDLIEQEQELLTCGPECQKLKKSEKLNNLRLCFKISYILNVYFYGPLELLV